MRVKKLGSPTAKNEEQDVFHLSPPAPHTALVSTQSFRQENSELESNFQS